MPDQRPGGPVKRAREGVDRVRERVDEEFEARHGSTVSKGAMEDEAHPEITPQSPRELLGKARREAAEGHGVVDRARRALQEVDRDVAGEYERREDPTAPPPRP